MATGALLSRALFAARAHLLPTSESTRVQPALLESTPSAHGCFVYDKELVHARGTMFSLRWVAEELEMWAAVFIAIGGPPNFAPVAPAIFAS
jgi:hypothetical protein